MKRILITLVVSFLMVAVASGQELLYSLCFDGNHNRIRVELVYMPQRAEAEVFTYGEPMFGGQDDIIDCLQNLRVKGADSWTFDKESRQVSVTPKAIGKKIVIRYDVYGIPTDADNFQAELFRPMISKDMLYCHGLNLFLTPHSRDLMQQIHWQKKPPFPVVQLWKPEIPTSDTERCHPMQPYMSLLVGSTGMDIASVKFQKVNGYVLTDLPEDKIGNQALFTDFFVKSMSNLRKFWKAEDAPDTYVFAALPFSDKITHESGGISLTGGFCSKYRPHSDRDTILTPGIRFNLAHEMGHKWMGGSMSLGMENQWFHEGFNDYLTFVSLREAGLVTDAEYNALWNGVLDKYYGFPEHTLSNEKVLENYWKIGDYNKLPYWRGCIFAHYLDTLIAEASCGKLAWKDFMRRLHDVCKANRGITLEDFISTLQPMLPEGYDAKELLDRHIYKGEDIDRHLVN